MVGGEEVDSSAEEKTETKADHRSSLAFPDDEAGAISDAKEDTFFSLFRSTSRDCLSEGGYEYRMH